MKIAAALYTSTAYANNNTGVQATKRYLQAPDTEPLIGAARAAEEPRSEDANVIAKRAKDIECMLDYWDQTDAIVEGYKAVRQAAEAYLPRFADEPSERYNVRLKLTKMTNVYHDVLEGLASKPFEEETTLIEAEKAPKDIQDFVEDVDGQGNNLTTFLSLTFFNGINSAIDWIWVDYPTVDRETVRTLADQKAASIKPYWTHVLARNVLEVRTSKVGSKQEISYIRIFEPGVSEPDRVRIFERVGSTVTWELWEKSTVSVGGASKFILINGGQLSIDVIPFVPFITGRRDGNGWKFFPPMQDAADLQIQLYQDESALKYIKTLAAYPMLAANGFKPQYEADGKTVKKVATGPGVVLWGIPDGAGKYGNWAYVEPAAQSMTFLAADIDKEKLDLRELGRQPLTAQSGNVTVITSAAAASKARSAVSSWALALKDAAENALVITGKFIGENAYEPQVNVYNEFDNFTDGGTDLDTLTNARKNGDLSRKTYQAELKRRKVLSPEFDNEAEEEELANEMPGEPDPENPDDNNGKPPVVKPVKKPAV